MLEVFGREASLFPQSQIFSRLGFPALFQGLGLLPLGGLPIGAGDSVLKIREHWDNLSRCSHTFRTTHPAVPESDSGHLLPQNEFGALYMKDTSYLSIVVNMLTS